MHSRIVQPGRKCVRGDLGDVCANTAIDTGLSYILARGAVWSQIQCVAMKGSKAKQSCSGSKGTV